MVFSSHLFIFYFLPLALILGIAIAGAGALGVATPRTLPARARVATAPVADERITARPARMAWAVRRAGSAPAECGIDRAEEASDAPAAAGSAEIAFARE